MYLSVVIGTLALFIPGCVGSYVLHEKRSPDRSGLWIKHAVAPANMMLPVRVGMTQTNLDKGAELLMEISSPGSPKYGQHLSAEEVHDFFAPQADTVESIISWLSQSLPGRKISQSVNKQWIQLEASAGELGTLLKAQYHIWEHGPSGVKSVACDEYSVPHHLAEYIDYITPGMKLHNKESPLLASKSRHRRHDRRDAAEMELPEPLETRGNTYKPKPQPFHGYKYCPHEMTPQCIQKLYNVSDNFTAFPGNDIGIYAESTDRLQPAALDYFFEKLYPKIPVGTRPTELFVDTVDYEITPDGLEVQLDILMAYPLAWPQNITVWYVDDEHFLEDPSHFKVNKTLNSVNPWGEWNTWLDAIDGSYCTYSAYGITGDSPEIDGVYPDHHKDGYDHPLQCGVYKPTPVISVSYSQAESWLPLAYLKRQCNEYMKLGLQGSSIFFSSGDSGAAAGFGGPISGDGCLPPGNPRHVLGPNYPPSCPWVTSVGATILPINASIFDYVAEEATIFSSGGFSNIYTQPAYQKDAISTFLDKHPPSYPSYATQNEQNVGANGGHFNRIGRGIPDVAAIGSYVVRTIQTVNGSAFDYGGGTSSAAPIWAGLITRINAARLCVGKKTVGFVNPTLYAHPEAFHDVVHGHSVGCQGPNAGWNATLGWDPVTGLGSPNYGKLLDIFMAFP